MVGTGLPNRGKSPQQARGEGGLLGRPALIPQAAGTCLGGWLSGALAEGWPLSTVPSWNRPSLSLHSCF